MRWTTKPWCNTYEWHKWFAWHPIRLNSEIYERGRWVWLEYVNRKGESGWDSHEWFYKEV